MFHHSSNSRIKPETSCGGGGTCLDTVGCFAKGFDVAVDLATCSFAKPATSGDASADKGFNVALVKPPSTDGICGPQACLIPIDSDRELGWYEDAGKIKLPPATCQRVKDAKALGFAYTTACATKDSSIPTCGAWSSVQGTEPPNNDAAAPLGEPQPEASLPDVVEEDVAVEEAAIEEPVEEPAMDVAVEEAAPAPCADQDTEVDTATRLDSNGLPCCSGSSSTHPPNYNIYYCDGPDAGTSADGGDASVGAD